MKQAAAMALRIISKAHGGGAEICEKARRQ